MASTTKNGNGTGRRASGAWTIEGFGKVVVPVKLYSTAKDKDDRASFNQYHSHDNGKVRYKKFCEICSAELDAGGIVKGKMIGDTVIPFTDEELESYKKNKSGKIVYKGLVAKKQFTPDIFIDTKYVGNGKDGAAPFKLLHEVMKEFPNEVALISWVERGHDHTGVMSVFEKGFLIQEIVPAYQFKGMDQVVVENAEVPTKLVERGCEIAKKSIIEEPFKHASVVDEYAETVEKVTGMKAMGEAVPVVELPQKKAEVTGLEAMLDAS